MRFFLEKLYCYILVLNLTHIVLYGRDKTFIRRKYEEKIFNVIDISPPQLIIVTYVFNVYGTIFVLIF